MNFYTTNHGMSIRAFNDVIVEYKERIDDNVRAAKDWETHEMKMARWWGLFTDKEDELKCYASFEYAPKYGYTVIIEGIYLILTW